MKQVNIKDIKRNNDYVLKHKEIGGVITYTRYFSEPQLLLNYIYRVESRKGLYKIYLQTRTRGDMK